MVFKQHVLPVLFIFLIPGFSAWFFGYAERTTDESVLRSIKANVLDDARMPAAEQSRIIGFYQAHPPSSILASHDPKYARLQPTFSPVSTRYAIFRWMRRIAWVCLDAIALTFVIVGLSVWYSLRSQAAQYRALRVGWPVLQISAAIQVLGQAVLAVALSFWVTALLMHSYVPKLILIIAVLAVVAVLALWKAIFAKVDDRYEVAGQAVLEADAPRLWQHVRGMAGRAGTGAPDQIIAGIEPSFFVTEHPVTVAGREYRGRTLYLSLPMLKVLAVDEADAVLGHELAHFSGDDTLWARKISPLLGRFALHLRMLSTGLSVVVAHFMHFFWKLYGLSLRRLSRQREFRADQVGAELASREGHEGAPWSRPHATASTGRKPRTPSSNSSGWTSGWTCLAAWKGVIPLFWRLSPRATGRSTSGCRILSTRIPRCATGSTNWASRRGPPCATRTSRNRRRIPGTTRSTRLPLWSRVCGKNGKPSCRTSTTANWPGRCGPRARNRRRRCSNIFPAPCSAKRTAAKRGSISTASTSRLGKRRSSSGTSPSWR